MRNWKIGTLSKVDKKKGLVHVGKDSLRMDESPSPCELKIMNELAERKYWVAFSETNGIALPFSGVHVMEVLPDREAFQYFTLQRYASIFCVRKNHPQLRVLLGAARDRKLISVVTFPDTNEVDEFDEDDVEPPCHLDSRPIEAVEPPLVCMDTAIRMFAELQRFSLTKQTENSPEGLIPFLYPDDGCEPRAHKSCSLLTHTSTWGRSLLKVWLKYYVSHVCTPNHPDGYVEWSQHIAPAVRVDQGGVTQTMVLDPSLFQSGPAPVAVWKRRWTGSEELKPDEIPAWAFMATDIPGVWYLDESCECTDKRLEFYRYRLRLRACNQWPPYVATDCGFPGS